MTTGRINQVTIMGFLFRVLLVRALTILLVPQHLRKTRERTQLCRKAPPKIDLKNRPRLLRVPLDFLDSLSPQVIAVTQILFFLLSQSKITKTPKSNSHQTHKIKLRSLRFLLNFLFRVQAPTIMCLRKSSPALPASIRSSAGRRPKKIFFEEPTPTTARTLGGLLGCFFAG